MWNFVLWWSEFVKTDVIMKVAYKTDVLGVTKKWERVFKHFKTKWKTSDDKTHFGRLQIPKLSKLQTNSSMDIFNYLLTIWEFKKVCGISSSFANWVITEDLATKARSTNVMSRDLREMNERKYAVLLKANLKWIIITLKVFTSSGFWIVLHITFCIITLKAAVTKTRNILGA